MELGLQLKWKKAKVLPSVLKTVDIGVFFDVAILKSIWHFIA